MKADISSKEDLINIARRFNLKLKELCQLLESAVRKGVRFDSAYVMSELTRGQGGMRSFYDIPKEEILGLKQKMLARIIDQDIVVDKVCQAVKAKSAFALSGGRPVCSILCAGQTGTGKTELGRCLAKLLFQNPLALIHLDMTGFKHPGDVSRFTGASPGYVSYNEEGGEFTRMVIARKCGVILLDEVEKAHEEVLDIVLRMLDEGKYTDASTQQEVSVSEFAIIMTSNLGTKRIGNESDPDKIEEIVMDAIREYFRPEFIKRFDDIVVFKRLSNGACRRISEILLKEELEKIKIKEGIHLEYTDRLIEEIVIQGYDPMYNARPLARTIDRIVINPLADHFLNGNLKPNGQFRLDWVDGKIKTISINGNSEHD